MKASARRRPGTSLVEALVALVLLAVGMLALLALTSTAAADLADAARQVRAGTLAMTRVETLRSRRCGPAANGAAEWPGGILEYWDVAGDGRHQRIVDSVELLARHGRRRVYVVRAARLC